MKPRHLLVVIGLVALGTLAGCATQVSPNDPVYHQLGALRQQVTRMQKMVEGQGLLRMASRQQQLESRLSGLQGQLQELQHQLRQSSRRQQAVDQSFDQRLAALEQGVSAVGGSLSGSGQRRIGAARNASSATAAGGTSAKSAYRAAFDQLKADNFSAAIASFRQVIARYPDSRYVPSAWYWMGETNYVNGEYQKAISNFQNALTRFGKSPRARDALLKIGYAQVALKDFSAAKQTFQKVIARYPGTTAAELAKQRLARMGSQGR